MPLDDAISGSGEEPVLREFRHIWVDQTDCLQLRERCNPLVKMDPLPEGTSLHLFEKVAQALLRFEMEDDLSHLNIELVWEEAVWINNQLHEEDYPGVHALLVQTWKVLYELANDRPYIRPNERVELDPAIWGKDETHA